MEMIWIIGGFFVLCMIVFFAFVIFLPEWVGITGRAAKKNIEDHQNNKVSEGEQLEDFLEGSHKQ